jgi:uncharacterized protein (DUF488 family)
LREGGGAVVPLALASNWTKFMVIYSIGHSNHPPGIFLQLLQAQGIEVVADLRSRPYSRFVPHFNRDALAKLLREAGIRYLYLGKELGGKPKDPERSLADEVVWKYLKSRPQFQEGLTRLLQEARQARVCVLCAEADPARCHRSQLIAPELEARGARVKHILPDGVILDHQKLTMPTKKPSQKRLF